MTLYQLDQQSPELLGDEHFVAENATLIGAVVLNHQSSIWFNTVLRADNEPIVVGTGSNIQDGSVCHTDIGYPLTIGNHVTIGHQVMLHGCTIGDGSLIGIGAVVLNGAKIGRNCLIGANTLIPEGVEIPDGSLVVGSPGRVKRQLDEREIEQLLENAAHYVDNMRRYNDQTRFNQVASEL